MIACGVVVSFSFVAAKSLLSQRGYQARVIEQKTKARDVLKEDLKTIDVLDAAYTVFANQDPNIIKGVKGGAGANDGDNPKIVLDALPSKYDFPALATTLDKMAADTGNKITSITGTDLEATAVQSSGTPSPVEIPFQITTAGSLDSSKQFIGYYSRSIRPFAINKMQLAGKDNQITMTIDAKTYYQPAKELQVQKKVVK
jgi:hypothetical protein